MFMIINVKIRLSFLSQNKIKIILIHFSLGDESCPMI